MEFADYLWELAHIVFKRKWDKSSSDIYKTFKVVGSSCDQLKKHIFAVRNNALILTATEDALDLHGKDRKLPRYAGENDEEYRNRLLAAAAIYSMEGTLAGMVSAIELLGYTGSDIYELYREKYSQNPNTDYEGRWAEFIVKLGGITDTAFTEHNYKILKEVVNKAKRAATKPYAIAYIMNASASINIDSSFRIGQTIETRIRGTPVKLDGSRKLDGTWKLDNMAVTHSLQIRTFKNDALVNTTNC